MVSSVVVSGCVGALQIEIHVSPFGILLVAARLDSCQKAHALHRWSSADLSLNGNGCRAGGWDLKGSLPACCYGAGLELVIGCSGRGGGDGNRLAQSVWFRAAVNNRIPLNPEKQSLIPATDCPCFDLRAAFRNHLWHVTRIQ